MKEYLADLIKINGPISVSNFMNEALFNPKYGYYNTQNPFGLSGNFVTAPEISQVFGELIGAYLVNLWQNNYELKEIALVEMGAGRGVLMQDLLQFAAKIPNFLERISINIIEISPKLQKIQQENLKDFKINWFSNFSDFTVINNKPIFFVANELLDCYAINQYIKIDNFWQERLIGINENDNLQFILAPKDPKLNEVIQNLAPESRKDDDVFEHSPSQEEFMNELLAAIKKNSGIAILIDYGYLENEFKDSLQAIKDHKYSNVLADIGKSDITAHVNFKKLKNLSEKYRLQSWIISQEEFLKSLGIEFRRQKLLENKSLKEQELINSSINRLIDKEQMGELFKVFICS